MRRRNALAAAICLAIVASTLPIVASIYLSIHRAAEAERDHLAEYANWTLLRAEKNLSEAVATLRILASDGWSDCSAAHIARMQQLTADGTSVEAIGFIKDGRLLCTDSGGRAEPAPFSKADKIIEGNVGVALDTQSFVSQAASVLSLSLGSHVVQVKPERLVDVLRDTTMSLGVALTSGPVIALSGDIAPDLVARLAQGGSIATEGRHLVASVQTPDLVAFAVSRRSDIQGRVRGELWVLVPIGLLMSILLVATIYWISRQRLSIPAEIATGMKKREFVPYYQPIIDLNTGACVGAEALVRWRRPDGSMIGPNVFIPIAEETGLIVGITDQLIDQVAKDLRHILPVCPHAHVGINLCAKDIESGRFLPILQEALERNGIEPRHIWLEATERGFIHAQAARDTLVRARDQGYSIAIDDFGTGYSSLALLEQLPLDALKIDKSFVDSIGKHAAISVVTQHIVEMAHELKLAIVAEGVETAEQEAYLRGVGAAFVQGWLYAKAMPLNEFLAYIRDRERKK